MSSSYNIFDRTLLGKRRDRASPTAEEYDFLLQRVADDLAERLAIVQRSFPLALDLGSHHGLVGRSISRVPSVGELISSDLCSTALKSAAGFQVVADEEALPFAHGSLDLIVSGLALQLVNDLPGTLLQVRQALKPDGLFLAAILGGTSLTELRQAWLEAEDAELGGASPRVAPFADVREMGGLLQRAGFALPVADADVVTVTYSSALALMRELKAMGASNMLTDRSRVPVSKRLLARAAAIYEQRFGLDGGRVQATFEIITLTAWAPHESQPKPLSPGSAQKRLADALGVTERPLKR